jgi:hypothetical protein
MTSDATTSPHEPHHHSVLWANEHQHIRDRDQRSLDAPQLRPSGNSGMTIYWSSLVVVTVVAASAALIVVTLVAFAIVGLSSRSDPASGAAGLAVAALCLLAVATIVGYGLYIIAA